MIFRVENPDSGLVPTQTCGGVKVVILNWMHVISECKYKDMIPM